MGIFAFLDYFRLPAQLLCQRVYYTDTVPQDIHHEAQSSCTHAPAPRDTQRSLHVPLEVVIHVLSYIDEDEDDGASKETLTSCALVSKHWSFAAQEYLFRRVTLRSASAFDSFAAAVRDASPRGRALASAVKRMHCIVDDKQPHSLSLSKFTQAVTLCPNLQSLHLALFSAPLASEGTVVTGNGNCSSSPTLAFTDDVLSALRNGPRISTLRFDNWSDDETALVQLLHNLPSVTALAVSGKTPSLPSPSLESSSCALQEIRLNFQTTPSTEFLVWLLHNSKGVLRSLEFQREPSITLLEHLVTEHCDTLESLALPACASQEGAALLERCTRLRELRLENAWVAPGVRRVLPSSLERLAIAVDKETPLQPVIQAIKRSEALSSITLQVWAEGERHPQLAAVKVACAARGIQLKVMRDIHVFRTIKVPRSIRIY
ncbi:hypothetical protein BDY19DRAFT_988898 [Irpex rosettiformis]|uniref:Uncharacterized protein n=1 Tax=Irpex rosettiformis TaxID=378272 RepID=A0ACB8ULX7_9APHY|nr:hypothetical protein BDY19DRAFT_988898 [Irpex rosettiformis]